MKLVIFEATDVPVVGCDDDEDVPDGVRVKPDVEPTREKALRQLKVIENHTEEIAAKHGLEIEGKNLQFFLRRDHVPVRERDRSRANQRGVEHQSVEIILVIANVEKWSDDAGEGEKRDQNEIKILGCHVVAKGKPDSRIETGIYLQGHTDEIAAEKLDICIRAVASKKMEENGEKHATADTKEVDAKNHLVEKAHFLDISPEQEDDQIDEKVDKPDEMRPHVTCVVVDLKETLEAVREAIIHSVSVNDVRTLEKERCVVIVTQMRIARMLLM